MANACVDPADFKTDSGGRLQLNPAYVQNALETFSRTMVGAAGVMEKVTEFDNLVVPRAGLYVVAWELHGEATNTSATAGTIVASQVVGALGLNGAVVGGTETMLINNTQGAPTTTEPAYGIHATGSGTRVIQLAANDTLEVWGSRTADAGTTCRIISSASGRCRVTAWRIGT